MNSRKFVVTYRDFGKTEPRTKIVTVHQDRIAEDYFCTAPGLGCGKSYETVDKAIRHLFADHALPIISIRAA